MTPEHFRKQAEALYVLARVTKDATERLADILKAMEYEARAIGADVVGPSAAREGRESA